MRGQLTSIGIVILVFLVLLVIFNYSNKNEGFTTYNNTLPIQSHQEYSNRRMSETNLAMSLQNMMSPFLEPSAELARHSLQALNHPNVTGGLPGEFQIGPPSDPIQFASGDVDLAKKTRMCEEYTQSADCSVWDEPTDPQKRKKWQEFMNECGLSLDREGTNSKGEKHSGGGLYVGLSKKQQQFANSEGKPNRERYFKPTLGSTKTGLFSLDKKSCNIINERIRCAAQKNFDVPNCSQCYTQDSWNRIDEESERIPPEFYVGGEGKLKITVDGFSTEMRLKTTVAKLQLPEGSTIKEGQVIQMTVSDATRPNLYGYLAGPTRAVDPYKFDLYVLGETDLITGRRPVTLGSSTQNDIKMIRMIPGAGKKEMRIIFKVPFSFIDTEDYSSSACDNGPFITQKASADFLNSNPCFGSSATPGNYNMECLQEKFIAVGGTNEGTGFPRDANTLKKLNYKNGVPQNIDQISEFLYDISIKASTGRDQQGNKLSVVAWNDASSFLTGKRITSPCNGQEDLPATSIDQDCLQYLYRNKGEGGEYGATYTSPFTLSSLLGKDKKESGNTYCQPGAPLDPTTATGKNKIKSLVGVTQVKELYNKTHSVANDNSIDIFQRSEQINDCYGVKPAQPPQGEVYWAGPGYDYTFDQAAAVAKKLGGSLATYQQLYAAWKLGANWCASGWTAEGFAMYPINEQTIPGCATSPGIQNYNPGKVGVTVFGIKPDEGSEEANEYKIRPFNSQTNQWNSLEVFQVNDNGYDKIKAQSAEVCGAVGAKPATSSELQKTFEAGGQWCSAGWVSDPDKNNGLYPMQQFNGYCGSNVGISEYGSQHAPKNSQGLPMFAVNCIGIKPNKRVPSKPGRKVGNFFTNSFNDKDTAYSSYDFYKTYRPIPLKGVGAVHPFYFPALTQTPKKVQFVSAAFPGGLWYANEEKAGLFEMVPSLVDRFTFTVYTGVGGDWERCSAADFTKSGTSVRSDGTNPWDNSQTNDWNVNNQKTQCEARGMCFNNKSSGPWCYEPNKGKLVIYIRANTNKRLCASPNGSITVDRVWDGPWEAWFLEPVPNKPEYVALRSYFGKYITCKGMFKELRADADTIGPNEQFAILAKD